MVEFVRDVIVAVAVLATLIAVAVDPSSEVESLGHNPGANGSAGAAPLPLVLSPDSAAVSVAQPE